MMVFRVQLTSRYRLIKQLSNVWHNKSIGAWDQCQVAISCWMQTSFISIQNISLIWCNKDLHWLQWLSRPYFQRYMGQWCLGSISSIWLCKKQFCQKHFCLLKYPSKWKYASSEKMIFFDFIALFLFRQISYKFQRCSNGNRFNIVSEGSTLNIVQNTMT